MLTLEKENSKISYLSFHLRRYKKNNILRTKQVEGKKQLR